MSNINQDKLYDFHNYACNIKTREIFLHNHFGNNDEENPGVEYKMSNTFLKNIRALDQEGSQDILVHMQSIGGEWSDGMAIFDAITMCKSKVTRLRCWNVRLTKFTVDKKHMLWTCHR